MNKTVFAFRGCGALVGLALFTTVGCSAGSTQPETVANSGSGASGSNGAASGTGAGSGVGSGAPAGTSGTTTPSGSMEVSGSTTSGTATGGSSSGAASGSMMSGDDGGASGGGGDGGGESGPPSADASAAAGVGVQADPGSMGDGTTMLPGPYTVPPESMGLMNGATAGMLTTPAIYASKTVYPGIKFQYTIFVPSQYQKGKPAALMIFLDGREWVTTPAGTGTIAWTDQGGWHADNVLANMIHSGDIPVTIAVFIDPGTPSGMFTGSGADNSTRSTQYDHPDDKYSQFTLTEFLPDVVLPNYDIVQDPNGWCGVGHSSGGVATFNMALLNPDKFHKALTFSASFPNTNGVYPAKILTTPLEPIRYYLQTSPNDLCCGWYAQNMTAAADLKTMGYHYQLYIGTSPHFPSPADVENFPEALRWMWRGYTLPWY